MPNPLADEKYGGIAGRCSPPHPLMSAVLRQLDIDVAAAGLDTEFEITFETTHHGPHLNVPTMFTEIGSEASHWGRTDAAAVYADTLYTVLGLGADDAGRQRQWCELSEADRAEAVVFISLGACLHPSSFCSTDSTLAPWTVTDRVFATTHAV